MLFPLIFVSEGYMAAHDDTYTVHPAKRNANREVRFFYILLCSLPSPQPHTFLGFVIALRKYRK